MKKELIERIEVGAGGVASIEFTDIPQDGVDLLLVASTRSDSSSAAQSLYVNNTQVSSSGIRLIADSTGVSSFSNSYFSQGASTFTANTFSSIGIYLSNYTSSSAHSISIDSVAENNANGSDQRVLAAANDGLSAAITSLKISPSGNFVQYSTASLYKVVAE